MYKIRYLNYGTGEVRELEVLPAIDDVVTELNTLKVSIIKDLICDFYVLGFEGPVQLELTYDDDKVVLDFYSLEELAHYYKVHVLNLC